MKYLLDTCIVSELVAPKPNESVVNWISGVPRGDLYLSAVTLGEIQKGISKLGDTKRAHALQEWLDVDLPRYFGNHIIDITKSVMLRWGVISGRALLTGRPRPVLDTVIAATAMIRKMTLVTRNTSDMPDGVSVFNPYSSQES